MDKQVQMYALNTALRLGMVAGGVVLGTKGIKGYGWLIFGSIMSSSSTTNAVTKQVQGATNTITDQIHIVE